jgi:hypothetical protein
VPILTMSLVSVGAAHGCGAMRRAWVNRELSNLRDGSAAGMDRRLNMARRVGWEVKKLDPELAGIRNRQMGSARPEQMFDQSPTMNHFS